MKSTDEESLTCVFPSSSLSLSAFSMSSSTAFFDAFFGASGEYSSSSSSSSLSAMSACEDVSDDQMGARMTSDAHEEEAGYVRLLRGGQTMS
jgi:hypothetical protein